MIKRLAEVTDAAYGLGLSGKLIGSSARTYRQDSLARWRIDPHTLINVARGSSAECGACQKSQSTVTAITARKSLFHCGWDSPSLTHLCPSYGGRMSLSRRIAATSGYSELHTYGCRACGGYGSRKEVPGAIKSKILPLCGNGLVCGK